MTVFANDPDLLARFRAGDRDALTSVYWSYVGRVEALVRTSLALVVGRSRSAPSADHADLVQEVFIRAFSEPARRVYDAAQPYAPLLMTIARNTLIDSLRRRRQEEQLDCPQVERWVDQVMQGQAPEAPWADPRTMALVERYVSELPEREHAVYVQRYVQSRSQIEAANALGLTRQQVRTLEARVRGGLARELSRAELAQDPRSGVVPGRGAAAFAAAEGKDER
jgi:RNA polymerase sigma factor (sigma-70 family)